MPLYSLQGKYTKDSLKSIIENKQNREDAARTVTESAGGKLLGYYGVQGENYHFMAIVNMPSLQSYMSIFMKMIQSGSFEDLKTVSLYTSEDVIAAATLLDKTEYSAPT